MPTAVERLSVFVDHYYEDHPTGGNLHIATDDYNLEDDSIEFCWQRALEDGDGYGLALAEAMRQMTLAERGAVANHQICQSCRHSVCLHSEWVTEVAGFSCQGPCEVPGCACRDAVYPGIVVETGTPVDWSEEQQGEWRSWKQLGSGT